MAMIKRLLSVFNPLSDRQGILRAPPDVISQARALEVFDTLRAMPDVAFGFPAKGCEARAHLMCGKLFALGLAPEKAWAFEVKNCGLTVDFPHGREEWWFHVAPALKVADGKGGSQKMVFDPSLFDGPVTLDAWGGVMGARSNLVSVLPYGQPLPGHGGDYRPGVSTDWKTTAAAKKEMRECFALQRQLDFTVQVFASPLRAAETSGTSKKQAIPAPA